MSEVFAGKLGYPLSPPPAGKVSDFSDHASNIVYQLYIGAGICIFLLLLFPTTRFLAKWKVVKRWTWDDLTCLLGVIGALFFTCVTVGASIGRVFGYHVWDVSIADFTGAHGKARLVLLLISECTAGPVLWLVKLSLFVLYIEVFHPLRWLRIAALVGIVATGLFYLSVMIGFLVLCAPKHGQTELDYLAALDSAACLYQDKSLSITVGAVNLFIDISLILLPLPGVWSLQMPLKQKLGVSAMFLTGFVACIASTLGLVYRIILAGGNDNTWWTIRTFIMTFVEMTAGIMICCMPPIANAYRRLRTPAVKLTSTATQTSRSHIRLGPSSVATRRLRREDSDAEMHPIHAANSHSESY